MGKTIELDPVTFVTAGYVGQPGQRVFYLQAATEQELVSLIVEKEQVQAMARGIEEFLKELQAQHQSLAEASAEYDAGTMALRLPPDPLFRVGQIGLGYDSDRDRVILVAQQLLTEEQSVDEASVVRLFMTRSQLRAMGRHGADTVKQGRPDLLRDNGHKH
jgi:uncharacterized repeat protein (TIGR03847 family)